VRSLLGLASYYMCFVKKIAQIVGPLIDLLKKEKQLLGYPMEP